MGEDIASSEQAQNLDYITEMLAPFKGGCLALSQAVGFFIFFFSIHSYFLISWMHPCCQGLWAS